MTSVYVLRDPRDGAVRYVGMSRSPHRRLAGHLRGNSGPWCKAWIRSLQRQGLEPSLEIHGTYSSRARASLAETLCIDALRRMGVRLTNLQVLAS
jgi:predicted GIY-YIG superfamily endonuclease